MRRRGTALVTIPWNGFGPEPLTADEWRAWLRAAAEDELRGIANDYPGRSDGIDARAELDRRESEAADARS